MRVEALLRIPMEFDQFSTLLLPSHLAKPTLSEPQYTQARNLYDDSTLQRFSLLSRLLLFSRLFIVVLLSVLVLFSCDRAESNQKWKISWWFKASLGWNKTFFMGGSATKLTAKSKIFESYSFISILPLSNIKRGSIKILPGRMQNSSFQTSLVSN